MWQSSNGFTLIEVLFTMGIIAVLAGIAGIATVQYIPKSFSQASLSTIISDLRTQQLKSMAGESGTTHGIFFGSGEYVLFTGAAYDSGVNSNVIVTLEDQVSLATTLSGNQIVFEKVSGEPLSLGPVSDQVTITNSSSGESSTIEINPLGIPVILPL